MTRQGYNAGDPELSDTIQNLLVSGIRLSAGLTLYGIGRIQNVFETAIGERGLPGAATELESALDVLSNLLESNMSESAREAARSVSRVSAKAVEKAFEALSPAAVLKAAGRLTSGVDTIHHTPPAMPSLAVDMLSGPSDT